MSETPPHPFPVTHWSLVRRAGMADPAARHEALATLLHRYLPALRGYLCILRDMPLDYAEELLQAFVADKLLEQQLLARADESRGRFRTFLLTSLRNFENARRRAGLVRVAEPLLPGDLATAGPSPHTIVEVEWARVLLKSVLANMEAECRATGRVAVWTIFDERVLAEILPDRQPTPYEKLIARLGLASPAQASNLLATAKRMYARHLRAAIAEYERDEQNVKDELETLRSILAAGRFLDADLQNPSQE